MTQPIIDLHRPSASAEPRSRRQALVARAAACFQRTFEEAIPRVLDDVDDALYSMSERAETLQAQAVYFESMRRLRIERAGLATEFARELSRRIGDRIALARDGEGAPGPTDTPTLALVDEDELEVDLAVGNMTAKLRDRCAEELYALERRLEALLDVESIDGAHDPLGPGVVCEALRAACMRTDASLETRLIVLKLFDRHLEPVASHAYRRVNQLLIEAGVLPEVRPKVTTVPRPPSVGRGPGPAPAANASAQSSVAPAPGASSGATAGLGATVETGAAEPDGLMAVLRQVMAVGASGGLGAPAPVMARLTALQRTMAGGGVVADADGAMAPDGAPVAPSNVIREIRATGATQGLSNLDDLLIDVVAMMFDYILDDRTIPHAMKALIARLQIPVLKVAFVDKAFFSRKLHPVRRFLNLLAEVAVAWDDSQGTDDPFFAELEALVARVLNEFEDRLEVFAEVLTRLEALVATRESALEATASEVAAREEEAERLAALRDWAGEVVARRLSPTGVPEVVQVFANRHWRDLLLTHALRQGVDGADVRKADETLERLVWSVLPKASPQERRQFVLGLPRLVDALKAGMEAAGVAAAERREFLSILATLHLRAVRGGGTPEPPPPTPVAVADDRAALETAIARANAAVHAAATARSQCDGMGATMVIARLRGQRVLVAHVGDSRAYRLHDGALERLTRDHSLREELMARSGWSAEEVAKHVAGNVVTRAVGPEASVEATVRELEVTPGDRLLLCSDGLSDMVDDSRLATLLADRDADVESCCERLVAAANEAGGRDNVTVAVVDVGTDGGHVMAGASDVGRRRSHNEDALALCPGHGLVVLADGMGGCNAGEVAAAMAVHHVLAVLRSGAEADAGDRFHGEASPSGEPASSLHQAVAEALPGEDDPNHWLRLAEALQVGDWVEFRHADGRNLRARLSRIGGDGNRYLFTDPAGEKVSEASVYALAVEMRERRLVPLADVPLVERAMGSLGRRLGEAATAG